MWNLQTRENITFLSPDKNVFTGLWISNDRSFEKKLGVFDIPGLDGSITQDKGVKSTSYTLTVYFDGPNHLNIAQDFYQALNKERGPWDVIHPTKGDLRLQLVSATEGINPTEDGNYTQFTTEWLEPAILDSPVSVDEVSRLSLTQILTTIASAVTQLQQARADLYSAVQAGANLVRQASNITSIVMREIAATNAIIQDAWNSARSVFDDKVTSYVANFDNPAETGEALIDYITIPAGASDEYSTRIAIYSDLIDEFDSLTPPSNTPEDFNQSLFYELSIISAMIATAQIVLSSNYSTRTEIISAMDGMTELYNDAINKIESVQAQFDGVAIDLQYFSQTQTFTDIQALFGLVMRFLITQFFNLSIEKRFTLDRDRSPLEITITEYNDIEQYQLFIDSNNLAGDDVLLLRAGREVVVYV